MYLQMLVTVTDAIVAVGNMNSASKDFIKFGIS